MISLIAPKPRRNSINFNIENNNLKEEETISITLFRPNNPSPILLNQETIQCSSLSFHYNQTIQHTQQLQTQTQHIQSTNIFNSIRSTLFNDYYMMNDITPNLMFARSV